jgi:hypothetical protein
VAKRIQMRRTKGWRAPDGAVYVGRPTRWGNPFKVADIGRDAAVWNYANALRMGELPFTLDDVRRELKGTDLICWCGLDETCHADILLRAAAEL